MKNIRERVEKILINEFNLESEHLIDAANFESDLGFDGLDKVEFIMEIEKEFDIPIPDKKLDSIQTIGEILDYLEEL